MGSNYYSYLLLGCTSRLVEGRRIYRFSTWAPNAISCGLVSDFTGWDKPLPMHRENDGIYVLDYTPEFAIEGLTYKFAVGTAGGVIYKGDPFARFSKGFDDGASVVCTCSDFTFDDGEWLLRRHSSFNKLDRPLIPVPMNIYEMHLGSFMRHDDGSYYSYKEMADILPDYLEEMGYTHVELLPLQEHPYDGSWGYQVCAFFAPTSRFGTPDDFKYLVNALHKRGIGVILDWVPAHFPRDEWGLYEFDGTPLYEYCDKFKQESKSWGTRFFDLGKGEVRSFLISSALYFLREFHIDALRVDAVSAMIYLDFERGEGEWQPNALGGRENLEGIELVRLLNQAIMSEFPDVPVIAEESTAFSGITSPVSAGGLGFTMKWNMGWANDFYDYLSTDPILRRYKHRALNFPLMYAFNESYILPISHDEVVHGKRSFIDKIHGEYADKFAEAKCAMLLQMTYPGKKLTFMGTEFAQFREWAWDKPLEWFMLDYPAHREFRDYVKRLNKFYLDHSELWHYDFIEAGFEWIYPDEADKNTVVYVRKNIYGECLTVAINFSGCEQNVLLPDTSVQSLNIIFQTDIKSPSVISKLGEGVNLTIPAFSGLVLRDGKMQKNTRRR